MKSSYPRPPQTLNPSYEVANPARGLMDRKRSYEHLQSSNESIKTKYGKSDIKKRTKTQQQEEMPEMISRMKKGAGNPQI